jgi:ABC-type Mn2+/Zn2+ transport system permease subunit
VIAVQALGNLLAVALILGPGAAGVLAARRLPHALSAAAAAATAAGIAGLELSHHLEVSAGAAIALCAVITPAAALSFRATWHEP